MRAMRVSTIAILALILLCSCEPNAPSAPGPAGAPPPPGAPFTVSFGWTPGAGIRQDGAFRTTMKGDMAMKVNERENRFKVDEAFEFAFTEETLKVKGGAPAECRRQFTKATRTKSGSRSTLGVQGKSEWGKKDPDGAWTWTLEGGLPLTNEDYAAMSEGLGRGYGVFVNESLGSGRPVKVGDSWHPDVGALSRLYSDPDTVIDVAASRATCRLASTAKRGEAMFGKVDLDIDFSVVQAESGVLNEPLHYVLRGSVSGCLDGSSPEVALKATLTMKGKRNAIRPGTTASLDLDVDLERTLDARRTLSK